ncbi:F-box protein PP2-B15-like isoform X2 [Chenopodium quinoa]|nr:F-box protein PP2-B15-like isoform X2 [Chenopodium quinoa]
MMSLNELPEDCVSTILSLSSPWDVCRSTAVCSELRSVAQLDCVWESFLPSDYHEIVSRAGPELLKWDSKKELFFLLCNSLLIDGGNKIFNLDKITGLKSYVLSARDLSIAWADDPIYWAWKHTPQSRFKESAELRTTSWLDIQGYLKLNMLSPNTTYGAYLIFKVSKRAYGLEIMPMEVSIEVGSDVVSHNTVYLRQDEGKKHQMQWLIYYNRTEILASRVNHGSEDSNLKLPGARGDGWMEIELGHFFYGESGDSCRDGKVVKMSMKEIKGHHLMGGLIVEGIEIRPLL